MAPRRSPRAAASAASSSTAAPSDGDRNVDPVNVNRRSADTMPLPPCLGRRRSEDEESAPDGSTTRSGRRSFFSLLSVVRSASLPLAAVAPRGMLLVRSKSSILRIIYI